MTRNTNPTAATLEKVWSRENGQCARCGVSVSGVRGLHYSFHHRRPRGMGGSREPWVNLPGNIVLVCGSGVSGCHGEIESRRDQARVDGFLVSANGVHKPVDSPLLHFRFGWVLLDDFGKWTHQEVPF